MKLLIILTLPFLGFAGSAQDSTSEDCFFQLADTIDSPSRNANNNCLIHLELRYDSTIRSFFEDELNRKDNVNDRIRLLSMLFNSGFYKIPKDIFHLKNLINLEIHWFYANSSLPNNIRKCKSLKYLTLLSKSSQCPNPRVPRNIIKIKNLESIFIAHDGTAPKDFLKEILFLKKCHSLKLIRISRDNFSNADLQYLQREFESQRIKVEVL